MPEAAEMAERLASCGIAMSMYGVNSRDGLAPVEGAGGAGGLVHQLAL